MLSEMDPTYFPHLDPKLVKMSQNFFGKNQTLLFDIYKKMLISIENWFQIKMDEESIHFDSELVSIKRIIGKKDISEFLFLIEYILIIAVKGD